jgi:hypothetical protein
VVVVDTNPRQHGDELTSRLNERREKLNYFIISASIAVIAFTLKAALDSRALFTGCRLALVVIGCGSLLGAAGGSLWTLRTRHGQEWKYIELAAYGNDVDAANKALDSTLDKMKARALWTFIAFMGGIGVLALAYILAIASGP